MSPTTPVFAGQVALVTGAARGIGAEAALALARDGAHVRVADVLPGDATVASIVAAGGSADAIHLDIRDRDACAAATAALIRSHGRLDMLVCNAGICPAGSVAGDWEQWHRVIDVNVHGTQHCIAPAWDELARRAGRIVIVSSMAFYRGGVIVGTEYSASKAALVGMTRHLARNGGPRGIRVNGVAPGIIDNDMTAAFDKPDLKDIPLGRLGSSADVAGPIRFLCGPESAYVTGTVINVTGGLVLAA